MTKTETAKIGKVVRLKNEGIEKLREVNEMLKHFNKISDEKYRRIDRSLDCIEHELDVVTRGLIVETKNES